MSKKKQKVEIRLIANDNQSPRQFIETIHVEEIAEYKKYSQQFHNDIPFDEFYRADEIVSLPDDADEDKWESNMIS